MSNSNKVEASRDDSIVITQNTLYYFGIAVIFFAAGFVVAWVIFNSSGGSVNAAEIRNAASEGARAAVQAELAALRLELSNLAGGSQPTPAVPTRVDVDPGDSPFWGPENAKVTIVEFSDFECSFCARFYRDTYKALKERYQSRVRFVFKHFPISAIHPNAERAGVAAECAREQGRFWEYHDILFENQSNLSQAALISYARQVGVPNLDQFSACLTSQKYLSTVLADLQQGERYGVQGTPTFFINGLPLVGAQPYTVFERAIEQALAAAN